MFEIISPMSTPWGLPENKTVLARGVFKISTATHGGLAVSRALALKIFRNEVLELVGIERYGYFWFEEDCAMSMALVDSYYIFNLFCDKMQLDKAKTLFSAIKSVERWYPDYYKELIQNKQLNEGVNMDKGLNENQVMCQSLNLTASLYLELKARHTLTDDEAALYHSSLETLNQGMQCGLVTWVNGLPLVNMRKLINW